MLDMMLSSHSLATGVGELMEIATEAGYRNATIPPNPFHGYDDPIWTQKRLREINTEFRREGGIVQRAILKYWPALMASRIRIYRNIFAAVPEKQVLVDSSKNSRYVRIGLSQLRDCPDLEPVLIWIRRDPRGVINSYRRKFPELSVSSLIDSIGRMESRQQQLFDKTSGRKAAIRYEKLAETPARVLEELCQTIGIGYENGMTRFWEHDHHHIGGNSGTKTLVAKFQDNPEGYSKLPWSQDHYSNHPLAIKLDERWRTEMPVADQAAIAKAFDLE